MRHPCFNNISANTLQVAINQGCGLLIFYMLSLGLPKPVFGELNWSLAVLLTLFGVLSFGIDQVAVRKIAAGTSAHLVLSVYWGHVFYWGLGIYAVLAVAYWCLPALFVQHHILLWIGIGKLAIFWSSPYKQIATGLEQFKALLYMATCSNILRSVALVVLYLSGKCTVANVVAVFVVGDIAEWLLCYWMVRWRLRVPLSLRFNWPAYKALLQEAAPQLLSVVLTVGLARLDWILIGLFCTAGLVANYSFAWKAFEAAMLPLLVMGPILLARFSKIFAPGASGPNTNQIRSLMLLLRAEMVVASGTALLMNILWAPLVDAITRGGYGAVNSATILLLSAALPFLYLNNFLWTINFARHRMKAILMIVAITFLINIVSNLLLIPMYNGAGAAAAFLAATVVQFILYARATALAMPKKQWLSLLIAPCAAIMAGLTAQYFFVHLAAVLTCAIVMYLLLLLVLGQLKLADWKQLSSMQS